MRRVTIPAFVILFNLLIGIILYFLDWNNLYGVTIYAIITLLMIGWIILKTDDKRITYSTALLLYTCATQFGLVIPFVLFGSEVVSEYAEWTLRFLESDYLCKAIILGIIAITCFELFVQLSRAKYGQYLFQDNENDVENEIWSRRMYFVSVSSLLIVLLFFVFHIITGGTRLFATYSAFRQSSAYTSNLYHYILILFYVATIYLTSAGEIKSHKIGWGLWLVLVIIFAFNGNKGEFLYASLAALGMKGVEGKKITGKTVLLIVGIVFLIIPFITSMRGIGIVGNIWNVKFNFVDAFIEMGMQIRLSVYCLEGLENGTMKLLWGKSYYQPVINMVTPFMKHTVATAEINKLFRGFGFTQVIESYLNFKLVGVLGYFGITGYLLGKHEALVIRKPEVAYLGTITCILINASRNYFAFVPGQLLIVTIIYFIVRKVAVRRG